MKKIIYPFIFISIFYSCKNETKNNIEKETTIQRIEKNITESPIELNNGNKWLVVPEMLNYIRKIETTLKQFEKSTRKDYFQLANDISEQLADLTSNCTMTGKAHDELHKWLLPFIELSDKLDKTEKVDEQKSIVKEMNDSFITFNQYFK